MQGTEAGMAGIALAILAAGAVAALGIVVRSFWSERADYVRTSPSALSLHPERTGVDGLHGVLLRGGAGERLGAWHAPARNTAAVVLAHGTGAERSSLAFEVGCLADAGFGVLALDLPGQGVSEGRTRWGLPERRAISAAVDWLCARGDVDPRRVGGFGLSMGGYVMCQAAALDLRLRAIALVSSPHDVVAQNWLASNRWGPLSQVPCYLALRAYGQSLDMLPKDIIGLIAPRAVLIVGGALDTLVPSWMARALYEAAGQPKELWIDPRAQHADFAAVDAAGYRARLVDFFTRRLLD